MSTVHALIVVCEVVLLVGLSIFIYRTIREAIRIYRDMYDEE